MGLEELINQLPTSVEKFGVMYGLTIQYKPTLSVWYCSYGKRKPGELSKEAIAKYFGVGDTPTQAVVDFHQKAKEWNKVG